MKAWGRLVLLACAATLLATPVGASAKPGYKVRPGGTELFLDLGAKGGYEFLVEANDRQRVLLAVEGGLFTATEYSTKGRVSSTRIEADLGELGRIDIRVNLAPGRAQSYPPRKGCGGPASIYVPGTFRGTIEFSGEGDVPAVSVTRGEIGFTRRFKRVCKQRQPAPDRGDGERRKPKVDVGLLEAIGEVEGRTAFFGAFNFVPKRDPARSFGFLIAGAFERRERVLIERSTLEFFFGPEAFRMSRPGKKPETVRVALPEPFAGRAHYSRKPGSPPTWTGNLRVDLPGADAIPLAGPDFKAIFCRGSSPARAERCPYGSGSQSQLRWDDRLSWSRWLRNSASSAGSTL